MEAKLQELRELWGVPRNHHTELQQEARDLYGIYNEFLRLSKDTTVTLETKWLMLLEMMDMVIDGYYVLSEAQHDDDFLNTILPYYEYISMEMQQMYNTTERLPTPCEMREYRYHGELLSFNDRIEPKWPHILHLFPSSNCMKCLGSVYCI